ncbi:MAG: DUF4869 domain-containing protein [Lachnospiraceae bacterium]|nr:DUF4869 domain-containing protein [Lachnospiraceae bacterium]
MEESTIIIHYDEYTGRSEYETLVLTHIEDIWRYEWMESDFAKFCVENIDDCQWCGPRMVMSKLYGPIDPLRLSGGLLTLLVAYNNKDKAYPISNLGDNCAEALYRSGLDKPTQWTWCGYMPDLLPEQRILVASTGDIVLGKDWFQYSITAAPDPETLVPGSYPCPD